MTITEQEWKKYIGMLRKLSDTVADKVKAYIERYGVEDTKQLIDYSYALVSQYGEGASALSALMYDVIAEAEGRYIEPAEPAPTATYGEVAKSVNGTLKTSNNPNEISGAVSRWVKMAGSDTTLKNAERDGAQFAWIPSGDTCAFCLTLASRGWQYMSKNALKHGHAEHIHSHCDCQYAVRFDSKSTVAGYDPDKYRQMYENAEGGTPQEKINSMRRAQYAENPEKYRLQKRNAYEERNRKLDYGEAVSFERGQKEFTAKPVKRFSDNNLYVADNVKLSNSEVRWINKRVTEAKNILGIAEDCNIPVVIVEDEDKLAAYNPHTNIIYVSSRMKNRTKVLELQEGFAASDNVNSTMVHELFHWQDAEDYRKKIGPIESAAEDSVYIIFRCKESESLLQKAGVNIADDDEIRNISQYAFQKILENDYDEVYTEFRTKKILLGRR